MTEIYDYWFWITRFLRSLLVTKKTDVGESAVKCARFCYKSKISLFISPLNCCKVWIAGRILPSDLQIHWHKLATTLILSMLWRSIEIWRVTFIVAAFLFWKVFTILFFGWIVLFFFLLLNAAKRLKELKKCWTVRFIRRKSEGVRSLLRR